MSEELAWLAGLFEGEGTLTINSSGQRYTRPHVILEMTDREVVLMFQERWPGQWYEKAGSTERARPSYRWGLDTKTEIIQFLDDLEPHFRSSRVRTKAALLREDVLARVQGSRSAGYRDECSRRRLAMAALNRRGVQHDTGQVRPLLAIERGSA